MEDNEEKGRITNRRQGSKHALILFGVWALFTAVVLVIGLPVVRTSIHQSGVLTLLNTTTSTTGGKGHQRSKVWFFTSDGSLKPFSQELTRRGGSPYHDTFETLLSGPNLQALKEGAVSSINAKTTLRGVTLSNKVLYIDLSRHFLESQDVKGAYEQLYRTGREFSQVKDIVLLIEGERATLADNL